MTNHCIVNEEENEIDDIDIDLVELNEDIGLFRFKITLDTRHSRPVFYLQSSNG